MTSVCCFYGWQFNLLTGCVRDGWREDPRAGGPRLQWHGNPSWQAGPLHSLWRYATTAVPTCHAGRWNRQWGKSWALNMTESLQQHLFYLFWYFYNTPLNWKELKQTDRHVDLWALEVLRGAFCNLWERYLVLNPKQCKIWHTWLSTWLWWRMTSVSRAH